MQVASENVSVLVFTFLIHLSVFFVSVLQHCQTSFVKVLVIQRINIYEAKLLVFYSTQLHGYALTLCMIAK